MHYMKLRYRSVEMRFCFFYFHWICSVALGKGNLIRTTCAVCLPHLDFVRITDTTLHYIMEHVVVSDWMTSACEHTHHRAKRKLPFERSQQLPLCEYDMVNSGEHCASKRSYCSSHSLRRFWTTSTREYMNKLAVLFYFMLL